MKTQSKSTLLSYVKYFVLPLLTLLFCPVALQAQSFRVYNLGDLGATTALVLADINNDGEQDVIAGNGRHEGGQCKYFLNQGNGTFSTGIPFGGSSDPVIGIATGDINGDGLIDILVGNGSCNSPDCNQKPSYAFLNTGSEPIYDQPSSELPSPLRSITVADVGNSRLPAAILGNYETPASVSIYPNLGGGMFSSNPSVNLEQLSGSSATTALVLGDLNKDGINDLVVGNRGPWAGFDGGDHPVSVYFGINQTSFTNPTVLGQDAIYQNLGLALADVNRDGYQDIVVARGGESPGTSSGQQNMVYLYDPSTLGGYSSKHTLLFGTGDDASRGISAADMNNDGRIDIVVGNQCGTSYIYLQDAEGKFPDNSSYAIPLPYTTSLDTRSIAVADLDGNGLMDIAIGVSCGESQCGAKCGSIILFQGK